MQHEFNLMLKEDIRLDMNQSSAQHNMQYLTVNHSSNFKSNPKSQSNSKYNSNSKSQLNNSNQSLQDLLQTDTINYNNLSTEKKRLIFTDMSFFSKDHTQDYTNQEGYNQLLTKIHFQRSRNRQLINQLANEKQNLTKLYLEQIMAEFKQLSAENKRLRQVYKRQAGGGYKIQKTMTRNNSAKNSSTNKNNNESIFNNGSQKLSTNNINITMNQTPRNSTSRINGGRKSITNMSVAATQQPVGYGIQSHGIINGNKSNKVFFGVGGGNFYHTQKLDTLRPMNDKTNRMHNCESSVNIQTVKANNNLLQGDNLVQPSPRVHKRRESQLTERKDYPLTNTNKDYNDEFLMMCDQGEMSFYHQNEYNTNNNNINQGRFSLQQQPAKMMMKNKQKINNGMVLILDNYDESYQSTKKVTGRTSNNNYNNQNNMNMNKHNDSNMSTRKLLNSSVERASFKLSLNNNQYQGLHEEQLPMPTNSKNIFIEFLQTLLIEEHLASEQLTQTIQQTTRAEQRDFITPSYQNIKFIEQLQKEITTKNIKLRQLQEVINVFKLQIEQIVGTDVKMVNQLMLQLLEVKGKYIEMQQKVNNIALLKNQISFKEKVKENIIQKMKRQQEKQSINENNSKESHHIGAVSFPIPQSIQTLFELLNINIPKNSKPIEYINQIKKLPKNPDLFQAFDSKKRTQCNMKIKQVIDQIKQGRKKFNQVIKLYEGRIIKLQEKIQKFKVQNTNYSKPNQQRHKRAQK